MEKRGGRSYLIQVHLIGNRMAIQVSYNYNINVEIDRQ